VTARGTPVGWVAFQGERGPIWVPEATVRAVEGVGGRRAQTKTLYHRWRRDEAKPGHWFRCACGAVASKTEIDRGLKTPCRRTTDISERTLKNRLKSCAT
jgi:hypothetical protein